MSTSLSKWFKEKAAFVRDTLSAFLPRFGFSGL